MARMRTIKPAFFQNEDIVELEFGDRLLFIGLWTLCDREGRLEDRPKKIKMTLFPADEYDVIGGITELIRLGFAHRYEVAGKPYIQVVHFTKHQRPHHQEPDSLLPSIEESDQKTDPPPNQPRELASQSAFNGDNGDNGDKGSSEDKPSSKPKQEYPDWFLQIWEMMPRREGSDPKMDAYRCANARLKAGETKEELIAGAKRYLAFLNAKGTAGTGMQMQMKRFFGTGKEYKNSWTFLQSVEPDEPDDPYARMAQKERERLATEALN